MFGASRGSGGFRAMVVSPHYLASAAGARMLASGGNAFDAAVAVSACLGVVYPHMTGMGGDSFWLTYHAAEKQARAYNGSGRSGHLLDPGLYAGETQIPVRGIRSAITVPGMVDSWEAIHRAYGRLPFGEVLSPAIRYAESGFPVSTGQAVFTERARADLEKEARTAAVYLPHGRVPKRGSRFVQPDLARSLKLVAERGREAFYKGAIAREIAAFMRREGGCLTLDDFAEHAGRWETPLFGRYRGYTIVQVPPNSQGFTGLMILHMLEHYDLPAIRHGSADYYHLLIEAAKLAFRDRDPHLTDPDFHPAPLERLLSRAYAARLAGEIRMEQARQMSTKPTGSDTAYAAVADAEGNVVSFIQSLYFEFGSAVVAGNTGILLQNRGSFFSLDPKDVNRLEPCKRTFHTLMPAMALMDGKPAILYGTQGGEGQPQTQTAVITRMIDYGMHPREAVSQPRWLWGRTWGEQRQDLRMEARVGRAVMEELKRRGHPVQPVGDFHDCMGHAHAIRIMDGVCIGGTDPRSDGEAVGL
jgi:gamma-glutamyltranspeptidase/glutathione hydrolase